MEPAASESGMKFEFSFRTYDPQRPNGDLDRKPKSSIEDPLSLASFRLITKVGSCGPEAANCRRKKRKVGIHQATWVDGANVPTQCEKSHHSDEEVLKAMAALSLQDQQLLRGEEVQTTTPVRRTTRTQQKRIPGSSGRVQTSHRKARHSSQKSAKRNQALLNMPYRGLSDQMHASAPGPETSPSTESWSFLTPGDSPRSSSFGSYQDVHNGGTQNFLDYQFGLDRSIAMRLPSSASSHGQTIPARRDSLNFIGQDYQTFSDQQDFYETFLFEH